MKQCPYCSKQIKENDRFCLGCGRQLDIDTVEVSQSGGISNLKQCFGSFPIAKVECYLCADEQKCSTFAANTKQQEILNKLSIIDDIKASLGDMNETLIDMRQSLSAINNSIKDMNSNVKRLK